MGMFDTVHTGSRCGQTKASDRCLRDLVPGDPFVLRYPSMEADMPLVGTPAGPLSSFQVRMSEGGFLRVQDEVLVSWDDVVDPVLPVVDDYGYVSDYSLSPPPVVDVVALGKSSRAMAMILGHSPEEESLHLEEEVRRRTGLPVDCHVCESLAT